MGEVFNPDQSKEEKIEKISEEIQISEEEAKELLEKREFAE